MGHRKIPVDPFNPGQVFACLGLMEAAEALIGPTEGGFTWQTGATRVDFTVSTQGDADPVAEVLEFLATAEVVELAPEGAGYASAKTQGSRLVDVVQFPVSPRIKENKKYIWIKNSALPIVMQCKLGRSVMVSYWGDQENGREPFKTWGGAAGKSGAARVRDILSAVSEIWYGDKYEAVQNPFDAHAPVVTGHIPPPGLRRTPAWPGGPGVRRHGARRR